VENVPAYVSLVIRNTNNYFHFMKVDLYLNYTVFIMRSLNASESESKHQVEFPTFEVIMKMVYYFICNMVFARIVNNCNLWTHVWEIS
jgi:hypothetical protein